MRLCTDLVFDDLEKTYRATRYGKDIATLTLDPPAFFEPGAQARRGGIYICTKDNFTKLKTDKSVLIIVCGVPKNSLKSEKRSIIVLEEEPPINEVFNRVQDIFLKYSQWEERLQVILENDADIISMIEITSDLMDECLAICNKELEIVSFHNPRPETPVGFTHLTQEGMKMFLDTHQHNVAQHEPFMFKGEAEAYCVNIYKNNAYLGVLTLPNMYHEITEGRTLVFKRLYSFIDRAIERLDLDEDGGLLNVKMVFKSLLAGEAVDDAMIDRVLKREDNAHWICIAAQLTTPKRRLPAEYFCSRIEKASERAVAIEHDGYIAVALPTAAKDESSALDEQLQDALEKLFDHVGVSMVFNNFSHAPIYFKQAAAALETGLAHGKTEAVLSFGENAFEYILDNCVGEFSPKYLLPKELLALRTKTQQAGSVDYWETLKCYLDNEMSASATARALYIHRTTLQHRIEHIEKTIDLSNPKTRLYLHFCLHLYDSYESLLGN